MTTESLEWVVFDSAKPDSADLIAYFVPVGNYVFGVGADYDRIKAENPTVSHWQVLIRAPK